MGGLENPYQEIERLTNEVNRLRAENAILVADLKKTLAPSNGWTSRVESLLSDALRRDIERMDIVFQEPENITSLFANYKSPFPKVER